MKVKVRIKETTSQKQSDPLTMKTYTLKANSHWNTEAVRRVTNQIHIVRELPKKISLTRDILECWHPTIEEDDGIVAYLTNNYSLWLVIGDNELYANEDSSYLFMGFNNCCTIDGLDLINTQNVQSFDSAFAYCGYNARVFSIKGLEKWNTSNVIDMWGMFSNTGYDARKWNVGDLSGWDTSNVTDMGTMFYNSGYYAKEWSVGNINRWDVSKVTNMSSMFQCAGYLTNIFTVNLTNWQVNHVADMSSMFSGTGHIATIWNIGILSDWDVSNVKYMPHMFMNAGGQAESWDIGNLSKWNVANVANMEAMFYDAGKYSKKFKLDGLEEWDFSCSVKRPNITEMFVNSGELDGDWKKKRIELEKHFSA